MLTRGPRSSRQHRGRGLGRVAIVAGLCVAVGVACATDPSATPPGTTASGTSTVATQPPPTIATPPYRLLDAGILPLIPDGTDLPWVVSARLGEARSVGGSQYSIGADRITVSIDRRDTPPVDCGHVDQTVVSCETISIPRSDHAQIIDTDVPCSGRPCSPGQLVHTRHMTWREPNGQTVDLRADRDQEPSREKVIDLARSLRPATQAEWQSIALYGTTTPPAGWRSPLLPADRHTLAGTESSLSLDISSRREYWVFLLDVPGAGRFWLLESGPHGVGRWMDNPARADWVEPVAVRGVTGQLVRRPPRPTFEADAIQWADGDTQYCLEPETLKPPDPIPISQFVRVTTPPEVLLRIANALQSASEEDVLQLMETPDQDLPRYLGVC